MGPFLPTRHGNLQESAPIYFRLTRMIEFVIVVEFLDGQFTTDGDMYSITAGHFLFAGSDSLDIRDTRVLICASPRGCRGYGASRGSLPTGRWWWRHQRPVLVDPKRIS